MKPSQKQNAVRCGNCPEDPKAYETEKRLREFCDFTSRELSKVLGVIIGEVDHLRTLSNPRLKERSMELCSSAAEKALRLARNLRYFGVHSKINVETADLCQVLIDTVEVVETELETHGIAVTVYAEASTFARIDSAAIEQVFINIIDSAASSMPNGGRITLSLRQLSDRIEVICQDTGTPVPANQIENTFEPHFTFAHFGSQHLPGLALAAAKVLTEAHGGDISLRPQDGKGNTFVISLPFDSQNPKPTPYRERRRHRRVRLALPATLKIFHGITIEAEISTMGTGGCFAKFPPNAPVPLPKVNDRLSLEITYFDKETIQITQARVANVCGLAADVGLGIDFLQVSEKAKQIISALVKSHPY